MKKFILILTLIAGTAIYKSAEAQVSVNINIGAQPVWGPVGYDYAEYYYLPDIECYYYVPRRQFIYMSNGRWEFSYSLPYRYRNYDLYRGYKVVMNEPRPYMHYRNDRVTYAGYRGYNRRQEVIRNSNDPRYFVIKGHPKYNGHGNEKWKDHDKGNGHGHGHDKH